MAFSSDMSIEILMDVGWTVNLIKFKRCLLSLDLPTRRVLLTKCLKHISIDAVELHAWFTKCLILSDPDQFDDMRKGELLSPEFWNQLYTMEYSDVLRQIVNATINLA